MEWKGTNNTEGRALDIYGKDTPYSSAKDLYGSGVATTGTKIGSIVYSTDTECTINGNYAYIGLRSRGGTIYIDKLTITWERSDAGGKTQTTLSFTQEIYYVNIGETVTVKAETNSTAPVSYTYTADEGVIESVGETGEVKAGTKAGRATVTANVEANDEYTDATATCTVNVTDLDALKEIKALVAEEDGKYHVMLNTARDSHLNSARVVVFEGKVVTEKLDTCGWYVDEEKGTIQSIIDSQYVAKGNGSTDLKLQPSSFAWNHVDGTWWLDEEQTRAIGYNSQSEWFGLYLKGYPKVHVMPIAKGHRRYVTSGNWGTVCLSYAVEAGGLSGADFFSIAGKVMEGDKPKSLVLNPVTTGLEAGVPYIFSATSDTLVAVYSGEAVGSEVNDGANGLAGSFKGMNVPVGKYVIYNNQVQKCGTGCTIPANCAYIDLDGVSPYTETISANQRVIALDDGGMTRIEGTKADGGAVDVYTIDGVEVRRQVDVSTATLGLPQGVYVVNGKKVVVK